MEPLTSPTTLRALGYLIVVNDNGVRPSAAQLDVYALARFPLSAREKFFRDEPRRSALIDGAIAWDYEDDSTTGYLLVTGMADDEGDGIQVTALRRAFYSGALTAADTGARAAEVIEVVGRLEDPVVYARLLTEIDRLGESLLVDPYLPSQDLFALLSLPGITQVLTRDTGISGEQRDDRRRRLAVALGSQSRGELRLLDPSIRELHDRYVIPTVGSALMIGTSLGGTQVTVTTQLSEDTTALLRSHYGAIWSVARSLAPIQRPDQSAEGSDFRTKEAAVAHIRHVASNGDAPEPE